MLSSRLPPTLLILLLCVYGTTRPVPVTAQSAAARPLYTTTIPYTTAAGGSIIIPVTLAGTTSADFLFDTGTNGSGISTALVKRLGLTPHPLIGSDGVPIKYRGKPALAADVDLKFGTFVTNRTPLMILDDDAWSASAGRHVDGVLGANTVMLSPVLLDASYQRLVFLSRSPIQAELGQVGMSNALPVPVRDENNNFLFHCPVRFRNGDREAEASLLIDSGATMTSLPVETASKIDLKAMAESRHTTVLGGLKYQTGAATITSIGRMPVPAPLSLLVNWTNDKYPKGFGGPGLGLDVLSHYRVLFDFAAKKMYLAPLTPVSPVASIPIPIAPAGPPPAPKP